MTSPLGLRAPKDYRVLDFADVSAPRLTHHLFRYPAKFHPPVAHRLIREYTKAGDTVLDPFCGSGTLMIAAVVEDRNAVGSDIDPVATFVSSVKTKRYKPTALRTSWTELQTQLDSLRKTTSDFQDFQHKDLSNYQYTRTIATDELWVPNVPNIQHWFRRYVIIELARILKEIKRSTMPTTHKQFYKLAFASIIRKCSNADPVPVSGLEVTSHMKSLDARGRTIDPYKSFYAAVENSLTATEEYSQATKRERTIKVVQADATRLTETIKTHIDAVITSPPYHNAVDYYRRHKLEMFWLGLVEDQTARLNLLPKYLGRYNVRKSSSRLARLDELGGLASTWYKKINKDSPKRADAFAHYLVSMKDVLVQISQVVSPGSPVVFVVGNSRWKGIKLPTHELYIEMAMELYDITDRSWYPLKNRYMSYSRHNGADIREEFVLAFSRR